MEQFKILRMMQKTLKKELSKLKIKIYYSQMEFNLEQVIKLLEIYDFKKKQLILVKAMRQCPNKVEII